jgi:phosphoribosylformylglycinamidine cyclo-ligase
MSAHEASAYREAGVDLQSADEVVRRLKPLAAATRTPGVESELGSFGGFFAFPRVSGEDLLVASIDGVGTKMKVARLTGRWRDAGHDIVAHCVDDILVHGARPLFFLDYIGACRLDVGAIAALGEGMAEACREAGCALLGGETAEMPGVYAEGEIDLVGCIVGAVKRAALLPGGRVRPGDRLIGLASLGLHTNGYSLARRALIERGPGLSASLPGGGTIGEALTARHRMYLGAMQPYLDRPQLHGAAHITGGGIPGNLVRVLPEGCRALVDRRTWEVPAIFRAIQTHGGVAADEMHQVFNMGIGWILIVDAASADEMTVELQAAGWGAVAIGRLTEGPRGVELVGVDRCDRDA